MGRLLGRSADRIGEVHWRTAAFVPRPPRSSSCTSSPVYSAASLSAGSGCWVLPLSTAPLYSSFIGRVWGRPCPGAAHSRRPQLVCNAVEFFPARPLTALLPCARPPARRPCPGLPHHHSPPQHVTFWGAERQPNMEKTGGQARVAETWPPLLGPPPTPLSATHTLAGCSSCFYLARPSGAPT